MLVSRISCRGVPGDAWWSNDRVFWGAFSVGEWKLHTADRQKVFEDITLLSLGKGIYKGICAQGSPTTQWNIIVSVDGFLSSFKYNKDCRSLLGNEFIGVGTYPRMFWSDFIGLGLIMFIADRKLFGRFSTDWLDFKSVIKAEIFIQNLTLGNSFHALWDNNISLLDWIFLYQELHEKQLGGIENYLL